MNHHIKKFSFIGVIFVIVLAGSCHYYNLEQQLSSDHAEFINKVRYIITKKENRLFLELPDTEKDKFIQEFWEKRDPYPTTEENEFKIEYHNRIEQANELFISEGRPGWVTDRGRIYILFGPPMDRITYPQRAMGQCQETWYYGNFPVVFVDRRCTGKYVLVTYDLTGLREINLMYMSELSTAQADAQKTIQNQEKNFNFDWSIKNMEGNNNQFRGILVFDIPYDNIWFAEDRNDLVTVLTLQLKLMDDQDNLVWGYEESFEVRISEKELKKNQNRKLPTGNSFCGGRQRFHR